MTRISSRPEAAAGPAAGAGVTGVVAGAVAGPVAGPVAGAAAEPVAGAVAGIAVAEPAAGAAAGRPAAGGAGLAVVPAAGAGAGVVAGAGVGELSRAVLQSLPRSDQRRNGELYITGLLCAEGRKTMRNIAAVLGGPAAAQRLHHLISDSTWDWTPVRHALAARLAVQAPPLAWVVRAAVTARTGPGGVGVDHFADPRLGRAVNGQKSVGLWMVTGQGAFPVDWRLVLPPRWLENTVLRARAGIPDGTAVGGSTSVGLDMLRRMPGCGPAGQRHAPAVIDARRAEVLRVIGALGAGGVPYLLRISGSQHLLPAGGAVPGRSGDARGPAARGVTTARRLAAGLPAAGTVTTVPRRDGGRAPHDVIRVPCAVSLRPGDRRRQVLFVERDPHRPHHAAYWLTDLTGYPTAALLRLARTPRHAAQGARGPGCQVGLHDFDGRSFAGWHRHITLASVAHAAAVMGIARPVSAVTAEAAS